MQQSTKTENHRKTYGFMRKEGDSNPRTGFAGYTLSRRASSATRAPFQFRSTKLSLFIRKPTYSFAFYISLTREHIKQEP